jgi:hypothetical protein
VQTRLSGAFFVVFALCAACVRPPAPELAGLPCATPANSIVAENCLPGASPAEWDIVGAGDPSIQGFATDISFDRGATVFFKVETTAADYRFDIYRLGYYGGLGARKVATVYPSAQLPQRQKPCQEDTTTGLIDCGIWDVSGSWKIPADATSGIYIAKVIRSDTKGASHIAFIVRDDTSHSDLLFQTSDTTWQAYNDYGGNSLYTGWPGANPGRAYAVSYNRPFHTRAAYDGKPWLFQAEYPMVRWLEANGYDVSYFSGVDSDRYGSLIRNHKVFLSVGHDEYWSGGQRTNVEAARDAGVNLAFFSGNEVFWKTRWDSSIDGSDTPYRTLISYKETHANAAIDPADPPVSTGTWRDPRFSPPADGGRPESALSGNYPMVNDGATAAIIVPAADGQMRFWRNTAVANLAPGSSYTMPYGTLGHEWDSDVDVPSRPAGVIRLSTTTVANAPVLEDYGSAYVPGPATHHLTLYRAGSGVLVFGAGTMQWSWGLDGHHDHTGTPTDVNMQQATVNLLADMRTQPASLQAGLMPATASTDTVPPGSQVTSPPAGSNVQAGSTVTIQGTATDEGGGTVGGVEVSVDGGTTWHPADGRTHWTYAWRPNVLGPTTIESRAVDDSGNLERPLTTVPVTVALGSCPCSLWNDAATPRIVADPDPRPVELGVKFRADQDGYITGLRFFKGNANTGTHIGSLWSSSGHLLAQATFTDETPTGWQTVTFATPVAIAANTVYVASYHAPNGHYAQDMIYFATSDYDSPPLHALKNGSGGNGVYAYSSTPTFPSTTYRPTNYWVDVIFATALQP